MPKAIDLFSAVIVRAALFIVNGISTEPVCAKAFIAIPLRQACSCLRLSEHCQALFRPPFPQCIHSHRCSCRCRRCAAILNRLTVICLIFNCYAAYRNSFRFFDCYIKCIGKTFVANCYGLCADRLFVVAAKCISRSSLSLNSSSNVTVTTMPSVFKSCPT